MERSFHLQPGRSHQGSPLYQFTTGGVQTDAETRELGWVNFELRTLDTKIGRWLSVDPYRQHHSPYVAMSNNPVSFIDPDGGWSFMWNNSQNAQGSISFKEPSSWKDYVEEITGNTLSDEYVALQLHMTAGKSYSSFMKYFWERGYTMVNGRMEGTETETKYIMGMRISREKKIGISAADLQIAVQIANGGDSYGDGNGDGGGDGKRKYWFTIPNWKYTQRDVDRIESWDCVSCDASPGEFKTSVNGLINNWNGIVRFIGSPRQTTNEAISGLKKTYSSIRNMTSLAAASQTGRPGIPIAIGVRT